MSQFSNLDVNQAHEWPPIPKVILLLLIFIMPLVFGWYFYNKDKNLNLENERANENTLKLKFQDKYGQVQNLENLKQQKQLVMTQVKDLEGLLPNKAEMDKLLSDINQAGVNRNLNFNLFEPTPAVIKDYYATIPVNVKIQGDYHEIATFMSDVASLSRIVNIQTMKMDNIKENGLISLEGSLNTYRLLEEAEKKKPNIDKKTTP